MDLTIIEALQSIRTPFFDVLLYIFTDIGAFSGFVFLFALLFLLYDKKYAVSLAISYSAIAVFNSLILKNIFKRPRPLYSSNKYAPYKGYPTSYSFPSGHSASIGSMTSYTLYESKKDKKTFFILLPIAIFLSLFIGFTRMYLGVHYLTDILVGLALGWGISYVMFRFCKIKSEKVYKWFLLAVPVYFILLFVMDSDTISTMGSFAAAVIIGIFFENRYVKYNPNRKVNNLYKTLIITPFLLGIACMIIFIPHSYFGDAGIYFSAGLIITLLVPYLLTLLKEKEMISRSEKETLDIGKLVAKKVNGGEVILLNGDLGSGKTVFARGFAMAMGIKEAITSPTFTIVNKYNSEKIVIYHFDMYRLQDEEEAMAAGLDELIDEKGAVKLIEWSEKVEGLLPDNCIVIDIKKIDDNTRKFEIKGLEI